MFESTLEVMTSAWTVGRMNEAARHDRRVYLHLVRMFGELKGSLGPSAKKSPSVS